MEAKKSAVELIENISQILGIKESEFTSTQIKYTPDISKEKQNLVAREAVSKINYRHNTNDNKAESINLYINLDKIKYIHKVGEPKTLKDLCVNNTLTNLFVFVLINQLAHYVRTRKLIEHDIIETAKILDSFSEYTLVGKCEGLAPLLNPKEIFANYYACQKIHIVLKQLEEINPEYLTYLDNI